MPPLSKLIFTVYFLPAECSPLYGDDLGNNGSLLF